MTFGACFLPIILDLTPLIADIAFFISRRKTSDVRGAWR